LSDSLTFIFQTAYTSEENKVECMKAGGNDFLSKPLENDLE